MTATQADCKAEANLKALKTEVAQQIRSMESMTGEVWREGFRALQNDDYAKFSELVAELSTMAQNLRWVTLNLSIEHRQLPMAIAMENLLKM
jgi:hypothetical protein